MKRFIGYILAVATLAIGIQSHWAFADGGTLQLVEQHGEVQIAIFTAPNPLRGGPIDVSVLVQDTRTGAALPDLSAAVTLSPLDCQCSPVRAALLRANATNQLMQSAIVELPTAGTWRVQLEADVGGQAVSSEFTLEAGPPLPRWWSEWPWFTWPALAVGLFAVHRYRASRLDNRLEAGGGGTDKKP